MLLTALPLRHRHHTHVSGDNSHRVAHHTGTGTRSAGGVCVVSSGGGPTFRLPCQPPCDKVPMGVSERPMDVQERLKYVTLRRAPRGRPDLAECPPRCVRTDGRVEVCAKSVPTLVEPRTFEQCVLND